MKRWKSLKNSGHGDSEHLLRTPQDPEHYAVLPALLGPSVVLHRNHLLSSSNFISGPFMSNMTLAWLTKVDFWLRGDRGVSLNLFFFPK